MSTQVSSTVDIFTDEITANFTPVVEQITMQIVTGENGASAYQIWLGLGNVGSEQDFIDSLKGAPGDAATGGPATDTTSFYQSVPVATYADAVTQATGPQKKIITVAADENDGTNTLSIFMYEGNNALGYKFPKTYVTA